MTTINASRTAEIVASGILNFDGATVSAVTFDSPTWGFAVAVPGHEHTLGRYRPTWDELISDVETYVSEHRAILAQTGRYVGAWASPENRIVLDVVEIILDRDAALAAAAARGELAIFDLLHNVEIFLP